MAIKASNLTERLIKQARDVMKPSPVTLHKIPGWLYKALVAARKAGKLTGGRAGTAYDLLHLAVNQTLGDKSSWLDHWGTGCWGDLKDAFISEPYHMETLAQADAFADLIGIDMAYSANSWWFPGHTFRIVFCPKTSVE